MRCIKRSIGVGNLPLNLFGEFGSNRINVGGPSCLPVLILSGGIATYISASTDFFGLKMNTPLN